MLLQLQQQRRMHIKCLFYFKIGKLFPSNFAYLCIVVPFSYSLLIFTDTVTLVCFHFLTGVFKKHEELTQVWYYFYILSEIKLLSWKNRASKRRIFSSFLHKFICTLIRALFRYIEFVRKFNSSSKLLWPAPSSVQSVLYTENYITTPHTRAFLIASNKTTLKVTRKISCQNWNNQELTKQIE